MRRENDMDNMTKEQVKIAPHYEVATWDDDARDQHANYYGPYSW